NQNLGVFLNKRDGSGNFNSALAVSVVTPGSPPLLPVWIAVADLNNDGKPDLIAPNFGNNTVTSLQNESTPTTFTTTDYLAIATDKGVPSRIFIYDQNATLIGSFNPFGSVSFTGGLRVAVGDVIGDNTPDLIMTTGPGGITLVLVFDGAKLLQALQSGGAPPI